MRGLDIDNIIRIHPLGSRKIQSEFHGNPAGWLKLKSEWHDFYSSVHFHRKLMSLPVKLLFHQLV